MDNIDKNIKKFIEKIEMDKNIIYENLWCETIKILNFIKCNDYPGKNEDIEFILQSVDDNFTWLEVEDLISQGEWNFSKHVKVNMNIINIEMNLKKLNNLNKKSLFFQNLLCEISWKNEVENFYEKNESFFLKIKHDLEDISKFDLTKIIRSINKIGNNDISHKWYLDNLDNLYIYVSHRYRDYNSERIMRENNKIQFVTNLYKKIKGLNNFEEIAKKCLQKINHYNVEITIVSDYEEMSNCLTEVNRNMVHSWAGETSYTTENKLIYSNHKVEFGFETEYEYYNNGNLSDERSESKMPSFNIEDVIVVYRIIKDYSDYNNNYLDDEYHQIIVYKNDNADYNMALSLNEILDIGGK